MLWTLVIYGAIVLALLVAELREDRRAQYLFKPLAALGFILIAIANGALEPAFGDYGLWILAALIACAIGDVLLLPRDKPALFKLGMVSFALGHLGFVIAFAKSSSGDNDLIPFIIVTALGTIAFVVWLWQHLDRDMKVPVIVYALIIFAMVITAMAMKQTVSGIYLAVPAIMFAVSDMFVSRDRFVKRDPKNAFAITPLYFGAQALFALSIPGLGPA